MALRAGAASSSPEIEGGIGLVKAFRADQGAPAFDRAGFQDVAPEIMGDDLRPAVMEGEGDPVDHLASDEVELLVLAPGQRDGQLPVEQVRAGVSRGLQGDLERCVEAVVLEQDPGPGPGDVKCGRECRWLPDLRPLGVDAVGQGELTPGLLRAVVTAKGP